MSAVSVTKGDGPVVLGFPHAGTFVAEDVFAQLTALGQARADTDWHVDRLYDGLVEDATTVRATFHRYVIDANRPPGGESLYPGQNTTGLVPVTDFDGHPIWQVPPSPGEIEARRRAYHAPYHQALRAELDRVRARHGVAILYDCHSIRSRIPFLFDGTLPDLCIGTHGGLSCAPEIEASAVAICSAATPYSSVLNGRFKGGWTTRHYGRPQHGLHAIQMELSQATYLATEGPPFDYDTKKADRLRPHLRALLEALEAIAPDLRKTP